MQMVGPWGRYLPQWLRVPGNGSGPAICQHTHTHTLDLTHHNVCFRDPIRYTCQLCIPNTHMHAGPYTYTLNIRPKRQKIKGSRTRPIMSTLMPRSGIPVICSRATQPCDRSYCLNLVITSNISGVLKFRNISVQCFVALLSRQIVKCDQASL